MQQQQQQIATSVPGLTNVQVEFVQCCLYAEQYRYAERRLSNTWPVPTSAVSVRHVLRYYYGRGCIHLGASNVEWAARCFWTCCSVPSDGACSAVAVAAWKKLALVRCITLPPETSAIRASNSDANAVVGSCGDFSVAVPPPSSSSSSSNPSLTGPMQLPKSAPPSLVRFLNTAFSSGSTPSQQPGAPGESTSVAGGGFQFGAGGEGGGGDRDNPEEEDPRDVAMLVGAGADEYETAAAPAQQLQQEQQQVGGERGGPPPVPQEGGIGGSRRGGGRGYKALGARPYGEFVRAFTRLDRAALDSALREHSELFTEDGNMGLVQQCVADFSKRLVYHYSRIYATIALTDLSNLLQLAVPEVETLLTRVSMELAWSIRVENGLVSFPPLPVGVPPPPIGTTNQISHEAQLVELSNMVKKLDLAVAASPKYLSVLKSAAGGSLGGSAKKSAPGGGMIAAIAAAGPRGVDDI